MAPSPSKERNSVYDIRRLVYTTWQRNRIENSELNEIDGISSPKRAFHRLCSSNREYGICVTEMGTFLVNRFVCSSIYGNE